MGELKLLKNSMSLSQAEVIPVGADGRKLAIDKRFCVVLAQLDKALNT